MLLRIGGRRDQILAHGQVRENLPPLRHQAKAEPGDAVGWQVMDRRAAESDRAALRAQDAHDRRQCRRFAHAIAAEQGHDFAGPDSELDPEQHSAVAIAGFEPDNL